MDVIRAVAGIAPGSALAALRRERSDAMHHTEGSYAALLDPAEPAGVSRAERHLIALRVAILNDDAPLAGHFRERLRLTETSGATIAAVERFPDGAALPQRLTTIMRHVDLVTREPRTATPTHVAELQAAGVTPRDIVTIAQLIAFVSYQVRLLAGLRLLGGAA